MFALTMTAGIAVAIVLLELTGLVAGGIVVPGYVSLILSNPVSLAILAGLSFAAMLALRLLAHAIPLYGTRRYGISILLGGVLNSATQYALAPTELSVEWAAFGYLVPGLIAHQFDRQGVTRTILMIAIAAPLVRTLVLLAGFL